MSHPTHSRSVVAGLLVAVVAMACGGAQSSGAQSTSPISIGVIGDFSGPLAAYGSASYAGVKIAADEINKAGGANGHQIEIKQYNEMNNPDEAVTIAKRVPDEVLATIVASGSSPALAIGPVLNREGIPFITTVSSNANITESGWQFVNRMHLSDRDQMTALVQYAAKTKGYTKIGILYDTTDYGTGGLKLATDAMQAVGQKLAVAEAFDPSAVDFSSQVLKVKQSGAQAILLWAVVAPSVRVIKALRAAGLADVQMLGSGGIVTQQFFQLGGADVNGTIATQAYIDPTQPRVAKLGQTYQQATGRPIDVFAAQSYDALYVLVNAIKKAGTGNGDRKKIESAIRATKYDGVVGHIEFDKNGQNIRKIYLAQAQGGVWKVINN